MLLAGSMVTLGQGTLLLFPAWLCESLPGDLGGWVLSPPAPWRWVCADRPVLPTYHSKS